LSYGRIIPQYFFQIIDAPILITSKM